MANRFTSVDFLGRWAFSLALVIGTYNPTAYSYLSWLLAEGTSLGPVVAVVGMVLIIAWIIYLRATFLSLGPIGVSLFAALFGCIIWLFVDMGWLSIDSGTAFTWVILVVISLLLAVGMSWAHIRRQLSGQLSVDDVEE
jgi:hypothetical protein